MYLCYYSTWRKKNKNDRWISHYILRNSRCESKHIQYSRIAGLEGAQIHHSLRWHKIYVKNSPTNQRQYIEHTLDLGNNTKFDSQFQKYNTGDKKKKRCIFVFSGNRLMQTNEFFCRLVNKFKVCLRSAGSNGNVHAKWFTNKNVILFLKGNFNCWFVIINI